MEPLAQMLRKDMVIRGLAIPGGAGVEAKCLLYMDDVNVLFSDERSIKRVLWHTECFCMLLALN